jgi:adenylate cyclase
MPNEPLPESFRRTMHVDTPDEMWRVILTQGDPMKRQGRRLFGRLPSNPRCVSCHVPFGGVGGAVMRAVGRGRQSAKNPRYCTVCDVFMARFPGGAEIELTMLFVDVRGSTTLAEQMSATEFSRLMNRFYEAAIHVLVHADAFVDRLVGDEVTALFIPGYAGPEHARRAVEAGMGLLRATGYGTPGGPWVPIGVGIHTGMAYVGAIAGASKTSADFTALGDSVNITARLAASAGAGEVLVSEAACRAAGIACEEFEPRALELKGKSEPVNVRVLRGMRVAEAEFSNAGGRA